MLEFPFNKVAGQLYWRKTPEEIFSCENCEIFKSTYFEEHLRKAAASLSTTNFATLFSSKNIPGGNDNF